MPKPLQNHQLAAQSTTPHPNQPQAATNTPSPMAQLAEQISRIQARFDSSPAGCASLGRSLRRKGVASASAAQKSHSRAELGRHRRKCLICAHPDRDAIEELFLHWHNPEWISRLFDLDNIAPIYRHAHATGLYARRRSNLRMSLEHLIEQADATECTGAVIVRAVRAYACLTDSGEWVEPASRVEFSSSTKSCSASDSDVTRGPSPRGTQHEPPAAEHDPVEESAAVSSSLPPARRGGEAASTNSASFASRSSLSGASYALPASSRKPPASRTAISNRKQNLLETPVSRSKQTPELISNRKKIADNRGLAVDAKIAKEGRQHERKKDSVR